MKAKAKTIQGLCLKLNFSWKTIPASSWEIHSLVKTKQIQQGKK